MPTKIHRVKPMVLGVIVQLLSHPTLRDPWTAACQASLSFTVSRRLLKLMSIGSVMPSNHLILSLPFSSHLQSFPASMSFPMSQLFESGSQSTGASAPVLLMNIQGWFPLGLTGLISLQSKGFSGVFSTVLNHQFFSTQPSLLSSSHIQTCTVTVFLHISFPMTVLLESNSEGTKRKHSKWEHCSLLEVIKATRKRVIKIR